MVRDHMSSLNKPIRQSTAVLHLQKSISSDFLIDTQSRHDSFVPFFKERDGLGKLMPVISEKYTPKPRSIRTAMPGLLVPKRRLLRKVIKTQNKPSYPSVGHYDLPIPWVKKTYSVKSSKCFQSLEINTAPNSQQRNVEERYKPEKVDREMYKLENTIDRKARRINVPRTLGIWECLKIYSTPEEIKEEMKFSQQKDTVKRFQVEIKTLLNELKR